MKADHRRGPAAGTQPELGEPEGPRVVDQDGRQAERLADGARDRLARPWTGQVDEEPGRAGCGSYSPGTPIPIVWAGPCAAIAVAADLGERARRRASGTSAARPDLVGTWSSASVVHSAPSCSTHAHLMFVPPRSRPRWRRRPRDHRPSGLAGDPRVGGGDDDDDRAEQDLADGLGKAERR